MDRTFRPAAVLSLVLLAACGTMPSPVVSAAEFGAPQTLTVHQSVTFPDALVVTLDGIDDSRCKPNVQCIWAGELSPTFTLRGGALGTEAKTVHMGTSRTPSMQVGVYSLTLGNVTVGTGAADTATVTVARVTPANNG